MKEKETYVRVALPLAVEGNFTYKLPERLRHGISAGQMVIVPFGTKRIYSGLVMELTSEGQDAEKEVLEVLEGFPALPSDILRLFGWMAEYYCSTMGQVLMAALPARFRLNSETRIKYISNQLPVESSIHRELLLQLYHTEEMVLDDLVRLHGRHRALSGIEEGIEAGLLELSEVIESKKGIFLRKFVQLAFDPDNDSQLEVSMDATSRAEKQREALLWSIDNLRSPMLFSETTKRSGWSSAIFRALESKGLIRILELEYRGAQLKHGQQTIPPLSEKQQEVLQNLKALWENKNVNLLKGVTGSGKTEVYIHLMDEVLQSGRNGLMLVPEIALTTQLIDRLGKYFGLNLLVYHSRLSKGERARVWKKVLQWKEGDDPYLMLGVRSSIFLPFGSLGLIVIDEEHDHSYKQNEPAPRYQARDSAIMLAAFTGARVLLGSATPSMESWRNAHKGKYGYLELNERFGGVRMPEIWALDLKPYRKAAIKGIITPALRDMMKRVLDKGNQVVLFHNRRGFSGAVECDDCGWVPYCPNCDVALTYHKFGNKLSCHYCGHSNSLPVECGSCRHKTIKTTTYGTERVEEEVRVVFPESRVARLDLDITRRKNAFKQIINQFEDGEIDILVGTQMITKGLDFDRLELVGILQADQSLHFPDFRANERTFQILTQVSGRAGRRDKVGKVMIQTFQPAHPVIQAVVQARDEAFYREESMHRQEFRYPPYTRLIRIELAHRDHRLLDEGVSKLSDGLRHVFGRDMMGPVVPRIRKIQQWYLREILLRMEPVHVVEMKRRMMEMIELKKEFIEVRRLRIRIDVDPD